MSYDGALHDPRGFVRFSSYELEKAPSGRAKCRAAACTDKKIAKGDLRFATVSSNMDQEARHCRHLRCVTKRMWAEAAYKHGGVTALPGFDELSDTEQELVLSIVAASQPGMTQQEILAHRVAEQAAALEQAQAAIEELQARVDGANNATAGAAGGGDGNRGGGGAGPSNAGVAAGGAAGGNGASAELQDEEEEEEEEEAPVFDLTNTQRPISPEVLYVESESEPEKESEGLEMEVAVHVNRQAVKLQRQGNLTEELNEAAEDDEEMVTPVGEGEQEEDMLMVDTAGAAGAKKKKDKNKKKEKKQPKTQPQKESKKATAKTKDKKKKERPVLTASTRVTRSSMKRAAGRK